MGVCCSETPALTISRTTVALGWTMRWLHDTDYVFCEDICFTNIWSESASLPKKQIFKPLWILIVDVELPSTN